MTPEQRAATTALEDAIGDYMAAYDPTGRGVLVDWIVLTAEHVHNPTDGPSSVYGRWEPEEQTPHRSLGLLDYAITRLRGYIAGIE